MKRFQENFITLIFELLNLKEDLRITPEEILILIEKNFH